MKVFVYGTLMKGHGNNILLENDTFLSNALLDGYGLYKVSSFPGIIKHCGAAVKGEVYNISEFTLKRLDALESEGSLYIRELVSVTLENNQNIHAYVYVWNKAVNPQSYVPFEKLPWKPSHKRFSYKHSI